MKQKIKSALCEFFSWCEVYGRARAAAYLTRSGRADEAIELMKK
jgi:hypothetical protein